MDSARWEAIQSLFHDALELPASERANFVHRGAEGDGELIAAVLSMLEEDTRGGSMLDGDVANLAGEMLERDHTPLQFDGFGPYRIRRLLGEGGMGVVYLAERRDLGGLVAIKVLRDAWMSPARRERFINEQRTLAQFTHPSIARLYDADTLPDGTPWFAMEYVDGVPITDYCKARNSPVHEKLRLVRGVCEAVQYAHSRAVIHRDLKPSNILVQANGTVKLLDFGIAKRIHPNDTPADHTRTGLRLMTPAYAAPEQVRGEQAGAYTDVYALGVILYELLAGRPPFELKSLAPGEIDRAILSEGPEKPSVHIKRSADVGKSASADLDVLCLTAMNKAPERRYRSAEAFSRDIDHFLAGEPLEARPDTTLYRTTKFVRRNGRAVGLSVFVLATITALILFYTVRLTAARNAAVAQAARTERLLRFTLNLFDGGDKETGPAGDLRVTALTERGIAEAASLDRDPAVQAELFETLGEVCEKLGQLDRADTLLNSALDRRKKLNGDRSLSAAEVRLKLGLLRSDQARFGEAEHLVRDALDVIRRNAPAGDPAIGTATHDLGKVLEDRGSYDQAIGVLAEAVRLRSAPGIQPADLADSLLELANSYFYAGRYAEAESLNHRLLTMHREIYGARHPLVAEDLINLGAIQQELGHYDRAEAFHRKALEITRAFYGEDHYKTASNLTLIARAMIKQQHYADAVPLLQRALAIQEKVFGKVHPRVASAVNELGTVALARKDYDQAEADFRRMVDIYRAVYAGKHYLIGIALANLGSVYMAKGDNAHAERLYRDALAMYALTLPPDHLNVGITRVKLGRVLLRQNRFKEAEPETRGGYQILVKQVNPSASWVKQSREDLAAIYSALHEPEKASALVATAAANH